MSIILFIHSQLSKTYILEIKSSYKHQQSRRYEKKELVV